MLLPKETATTKQVNLKAPCSNIYLKALLIIVFKISISFKRIPSSLMDILKPLYLEKKKIFAERLLKFILM